MTKPRMTWHTVQVLKVLLQTPDRERWGADLVAQTGFRQSTVQPILVRLERVGIISTRWEDSSEAPRGRPNRRYVKLTDVGREVAEQAVADDPAPPPNINLRPEVAEKVAILAVALHAAGVGLTEHEVDLRESIAERLDPDYLEVIAGWISRASQTAEHHYARRVDPTEEPPKHE